MELLIFVRIGSVSQSVCKSQVVLRGGQFLRRLPSRSGRAAVARCVAQTTGATQDLDPEGEHLPRSGLWQGGASDAPPLDCSWRCLEPKVARHNHREPKWLRTLSQTDVDDRADGGANGLGHRNTWEPPATIAHAPDRAEDEPRPKQHRQPVYELIDSRPINAKAIGNLARREDTDKPDPPTAPFRAGYAPEDRVCPT